MKKFWIFIVLVQICFYVLSFWFRSPIQAEMALMPVSRQFIFGTDDLGRSFFWELWRATGNSLLLASVAFLLSLGIAFVFFLGSFRNAFIKKMIFAFIQWFDSLPSLIWISIVMIVFASQRQDSGRFYLLAFLLGLNYFPYVFRSGRGFFDQVTKEPYIEAAEALGLSKYQILKKHIMPEVFRLVYPKWIGAWAQIVIAEGFYSFLGLGLRPTTPSLGSLMNKGWYYFLDSPHLMVIPGSYLTIIFFAVRMKLRASLSGGPLKAQETDQ